MKIKDPFNLEEQWKFYLYVTKQDEARMHPVQLVETRRSFYAGVGQILLLLRDTFGSMTEEEAVVQLENLLKQVNNFWLKQSNRQN